MRKHSEGEPQDDAGHRHRFVGIIRQIEDMRHGLDLIEYETVQLVRDGGASWEQIGDELEISRQAASRRFSHPKPRRRR